MPPDARSAIRLTIKIGYLRVCAALPVSASISGFNSNTSDSQAVVSKSGFDVRSLSSITTHTEASKDSISSGILFFFGMRSRATPLMKSIYLNVRAPRTGADAGLAAGDGTHFDIKYRTT